MAVKKVFVDLDVQTGSNVNVQSNLSVTGTSTLRTADLRQTIFTKQTLNLTTDGGFINTTISPDTSVLVLTGSGKGNTLNSVSPSSGSFQNGKILTIVNNSNYYVFLTTSTYGYGSYAFIESAITFNPINDPSKGFFPTTIFYGNNPPAFGITKQINTYESITFQFESGSNFWRPIFLSSREPTYLLSVVDTQNSYYADSTTDFILNVDLPFASISGFKNFSNSLRKSNNASFLDDSDPFEKVELHSTYTNLSNSLTLIANKSLLETFRASKRYIYFYTIF